MPELILHHYPVSPFSEKIRLILGFKKLSWKSVHIPIVMPKPDLVALTGGYRKTPVLQIGADIYCDTALICDLLEHLQPSPTLYPEPVKGVARVLAQWADTTLFWTAMAHHFGPQGAAQIFATLDPAIARAFPTDRASMRIGVPRLKPADASAAYKSYLRRLAHMLHERPFLLGQEPCLADFAAYHPLWMGRKHMPATAEILVHTPVVLEWMDRMATIGHGTHSPSNAQAAIELATAAEPAPLDDPVFQDDHGLALGSRVTISSDNFGPEPTEGELVAATRMHYTLRRTDPRVGTVHVHFPRIGYAMRAAAAA